MNQRQKRNNQNNPKRKKQKRNENFAQKENEGSSSEEESNQFETQFQELVDSLMDSDSITRKEKYTELNHHISHYYLPIVEEFYDDALFAIKNSLKKGSAEEQVLAIKCLLLFSITVENTTSDIYNQFESILLKYSLEGENKLKIASLEALGILAYFMTSTGDLDPSQNILRHCISILKNNILPENGGHELYIAKVMKVCSLLLSLQETDFIGIELSDNNQLGDDIFFDYIVNIGRNFLEYPDLGVRVSSGELIALAFNLKDRLEMEEVVDTNIDVDQVIEIFTKLMKEYSQKVSKKTKKIQRSKFKTFLSSIEECDYPTDLITIKSNKIHLEEWPKIIQLNTIRAFLGSGFQKHIEKNFLFSALFGYQIKVETRKQKFFHKRTQRKEQKKNKKSRQQTRAKDRKKKNHVEYNFM
ncbi:interferon-related developmental regulator [Anaeramoeba flamelloides]|uniref:Interferon-related developmental regulator n=1 Tax=Anaeramoeba flamelloides TaxID=1746091 RepID=A0AAV7ZNX6_9EUKA|nr:interferon-related developmental regulator [Anaeramoeba flamelloides]